MNSLSLLGRFVHRHSDFGKKIPGRFRLGVQSLNGATTKHDACR